MSPADVAKLTGVGRSTLNGWTIGEFKPYFSPSAQGGENRTRDFTDHDVRLIVLLRQLTNAHKSRPEIHAELRRLEAGDWEDLPPMPASRTSAEVPVVPAAAVDAEVKNQRLLYDQRVKGLEAAIRKADDRLEAERARHDLFLREIGDLKAKIGELQAVLRLYESGRLKPSE